MKTKNNIILFLLMASIFNAQENPEDEIATKASNTTNPLAFVTELQVQPNHIWKDNGGAQINVT